MRNRRTWIFLVAALCLISVSWLGAQNPASQPSDQALTEEQMKDFLLRANVTASRILASSRMPVLNSSASNATSPAWVAVMTSVTCRSMKSMRTPSKPSC